MAPYPLENGFEHRPCQASRLGILLAKEKIALVRVPCERLLRFSILVEDGPEKFQNDHYSS